MSGVVLFLGGVAALAAMSVVAKATVRARRAAALADIVQAGTSPFSLLGRIVVGAAVIVGVEWWTVTHSTNNAVWWAVLGLPALVTSYAVVKATTVVQAGPRRRGGGRR